MCAGNFSFDITSEVDLNELDNAINMAMKEINNRFDFKGSVSKISRSNKEIEIISDDEMKLRNVKGILEGKMIKRDISPRFLDYQKSENSLGGNFRQIVLIKQGISKEKAKELNQFIKKSKLKVNTQINDDKIKVVSPKKDILQQAIQKLKNEDFGIELHFGNFR